MSCSKGRTNPKLWASAKRRAIAKLGGKFSARAMQLAGQYYRKGGGGYCGSKSSGQRSLSKWTKEKWTTADGKKAERVVRGKKVMDRYLPAKAWKRLSKTEKAATRSKKRSAGAQWVPNTKKAASAGRAARNEDIARLIFQLRQLVEETRRSSSVLA